MASGEELSWSVGFGASKTVYLWTKLVKLDDI